MPNNLSANELYAKMLQYGSEHLDDGISLVEIKRRLTEKGFLKNNSSDEYLKHWFAWSFEHKAEGCKCEYRPESECDCNKDDPCYNYDHILNCKHFLSKDACIDYLHLNQAENNLKSAKISRQISYVALLISSGILLLSFLNNFAKENFLETQEYKEIKQEIIELKTNSLSTSKYLYQLDTTITNQIPRVEELHKSDDEILNFLKVIVS